MNTDLINALLKSTKHVIETMANLGTAPGRPTLKSSNRTWGVISGLIGLAGEQVNGNLMLSFDEESILAVVNNMLGETFSEVNHDVQDAVGELTNMISGAAKVELRSRGYQFEMAIPITVVGKEVEISQMGHTSIIQIPFSLTSGETPTGTFVIECNLEDKPKS